MFLIFLKWFSSFSYLVAFFQKSETNQKKYLSPLGKNISIRSRKQQTNNNNNKPSVFLKRLVIFHSYYFLNYVVCFYVPFTSSGVACSCGGKRYKVHLFSVLCDPWLALWWVTGYVSLVHVREASKNTQQYWLWGCCHVRVLILMDMYSFMRNIVQLHYSYKQMHSKSPLFHYQCSICFRITEELNLRFFYSFVLSQVVFSRAEEQCLNVWYVQILYFLFHGVIYEVQIAFNDHLKLKRMLTSLLSKASEAKLFQKNRKLDPFCVWGTLHEYFFLFFTTGPWILEHKDFRLGFYSVKML